LQYILYNGQCQIETRSQLCRFCGTLSYHGPRSSTIVVLKKVGLIRTVRSRVSLEIIVNTVDFHSMLIAEYNRPLHLRNLPFGSSTRSMGIVTIINYNGTVFLGTQHSCNIPPGRHLYNADADLFQQ